MISTAACLLAGLALGVPAQLHATVQAAERTEVRARAPGDGQAASSFDLAATPSMTLGLAGRTVQTSFGYAPRYTLLDFAQSPQSTLLHTGSFRTTWAATRRLRLSIEQGVTYGRYSFASLDQLPAGGPTAAPNLLPRTVAVQYGTLYSALGAQSSLARRWTLSTVASYAQSGGIGQAAQDVMPLMRGPRLDVSLTHALTRTDSLITDADVSYVYTSSGQRYALAEAGETWRRGLARDTNLQLRAGATGIESRLAGTHTWHAVVYPTAEMLVSRRIMRRQDQLSASTRLRLAPTANRLTGEVDQRAWASASGERTAGLFTLGAQVDAAQSIPVSAPAANRLVFATLFGRLRLGALATAETGVRLSWQAQRDVPSFPVTRVVYVAVGLSAPVVEL